MLIIKVLGIIILSAVGLLLGSNQVAKLRRRSDALYWFSTNIVFIGEHIRATANEVYDIVNSLCGKENYLRLSRPFKIEIKSEFLNKDDLLALNEFFGSLGRLDTESEIKRCEMYGKIIENRFKSAHKDFNEKNKLYKMLGLFSGLSVAIVIM